MRHRYHLGNSADEFIRTKHFESGWWLVNETVAQTKGFREKTRFDLVATGRPYTDFFVDDEDGELIQRLGVAKGGATQVDAGEMLSLLPKVSVRSVQAGGSPANTCAVVSALGGRALFLGKTCDDQAGRLFREGFSSTNVQFPSKSYSGVTAGVSGSCVILRSRDGTETMIHCAGVGDLLDAEDLRAETISECAVFYLQAHLLFADESRAAVALAIEQARAAGRQVAFSLHDHQMDARRAKLFVSSHLAKAALVLGNKREFDEVFGSDFARYIDAEQLLVVTDGAHGATIRGRGRAMVVPAVPPRMIMNTIGAGDAFAGGLLFGMAIGLELDQSAELAARAASSILELPGGRPDGDWSRFTRSYLSGSGH